MSSNNPIKPTILLKVVGLMRCSLEMVKRILRRFVYPGQFTGQRCLD
jgi:hypothetical protein